MGTKSMPWSSLSTDYNEVIKLIGEFSTPPKFPSHFSIEGKEFLKSIFKSDPSKRPSAEELLKHRWLCVDEDVIIINENRKNDENRVFDDVSKKGIGIKVVESVKIEKKVLVNMLNENDTKGDFSVTMSDYSIEEKENEKEKEELGKNEEYLKFEEEIKSRLIRNSSLMEGNKKENNFL